MVTKDGYRYEVTNKEIRLWKDTQDLDESPCLFQELDPLTSQPFISDVAATEWVEEYIRIANLPPIEPVVDETPEEPITE